jgi:hypothetical protein
MKFVIKVLVILLAVYGVWSLVNSPTADGKNGDDMAPTPIMTATATPQVTQAPSLAIETTPTVGPVPTAQRVQFPLGSWGDTISGHDHGRYLLWAREGQTLTIESIDGENVGITIAVDGAQTLVFGQVGDKPGVRLPVSGDYVIDISASGNYSVAVEIR